MPLQWAMTQNNLGNALARLGERESGTGRLEEAAAAYREALKEWTCERLPLQWATTQNNLGNALTRLGGREGGTERLEEAVAAYVRALEVFTPDNAPNYQSAALSGLTLARKLLAARRPNSDN
ncbi:MAG TPA: tetratricopeptide repeat protein [Bryobacterales bacterium]|nr:tetratricopeptide repeat protein [Bryobacterales bacterium]